MNETIIPNPIDVNIKLDGNLVTNNVKDFTEQVKQCIELYAKKDHDYGDSFSKGMNDIGSAYGVGRIYDKVNRLVTLTKEQTIIKEESVDDTLRDLACYSIMMLVYRKHCIDKEHKNIDFE